MAVTNEGISPVFNSTVAKLKNWSKSHTDTQLIEWGEYLNTLPATGKKKQVSFYFNPRLEEMQAQPAPGITAVRMRFNHNAWSKSDNKAEYMNDIIRDGILDYMEQIRADKFNTRSLAFWRHNFNLGIVCREDLPNVPIEHLIDIGNINTPEEFMEEFITNTEYDLNWFFGCDTDSIKNFDEKRIVDGMMLLLKYDFSNEKGEERRHQILKLMQLNTTVIAKGMESWRVFDKELLASNKEHFVRNTLANPMFKVELLYRTLKSEGRLKELKPIVELYYQLLSTPYLTVGEKNTLAFVAREVGIETDIYMDGKPSYDEFNNYLISNNFRNEAQENTDRVFFKLKTNAKLLGINELIDCMKLYPNAEFYLESNSYKGLQVLQDGFLDAGFDADDSPFKNIVKKVGEIQLYRDRIHIAPDNTKFVKGRTIFVRRT